MYFVHLHSLPAVFCILCSAPQLEGGGQHRHVAGVSDDDGATQWHAFIFLCPPPDSVLCPTMWNHHVTSCDVM
jgi:hypothetical protein